MTIEKNRYMMSSIFDSTGKFQLDEALVGSENKDPRVDGENIIGSVEGVFFVPDGFSRNNRFYPCELWNKQLSDEDINRRLSNSIMFGCIGHSQGPVTEQDLSDGKVSHIMDKLWIDENTGMGMGKAYILNTPAGKNLKTYLKAGSNLKVSSRGEGSFAEGIEKDGHPVVEAASYNLITFDFVIEPGFVETNPQLQEGYIEEVLIENSAKAQIEETAGKEESMDEKLLEDLKAEKEQAVKSLEECQSKHSKEIETLKKRISSLRESLEKAKRETSISESKANRVTRLVESYKKLGSVRDIKKASSISEAVVQELKDYKTMGTKKEMQEVLDRLVKMSKELREYHRLGSLDSLKKLLSMSERFLSMQGRKEVVSEAKEMSDKSGKSIVEVSEMIKEEGVKETSKKLNENEETTKKVDIILETKPSTEEKAPRKATKEEESISMLEELLAETKSRMLISEAEEDEDEEKKPTEDEEEKEEETPSEEGEEKEDVEGEETPEDEENIDDEISDEEPETEEERLDTLEDDVDNLQSQIDALTAAFDRLEDENAVYDEDDEFDFEIE